MILERPEPKRKRHCKGCRDFVYIPHATRDGWVCDKCLFTDDMKHDDYKMNLEDFIYGNSTMGPSDRMPSPIEYGDVKELNNLILKHLKTQGLDQTMGEWIKSCLDAHYAESNERARKNKALNALFETKIDHRPDDLDKQLIKKTVNAAINKNEEGN